MTPEALALEERITEAGQKVQTHYMNGHAQKARDAFEVVRELVAQRTPETIAEMEEERGLRHA